MLEKNIVVRISIEDWEHMMELKKQGINISQILRNYLVEFYEKNKKVIKTIK